MTRKTFRKIITSEEHDKNINKKNIEIRDRFLREKSRSVSETTVKGYFSDLRIFFTWNLLHNDNKFFVDIKKLDYSDFFYFASETLKWGNSRQNRMRSSLSSLSSYIEKYFDDEYPYFRNIVIKVIDSAPKEKRREKTILSDEDVENVLSHFSKNDKQIACWFALSVYSGMRFSELLRINVSTINNAKDAFDGLFLYTEPIKVKGRGGNRKDNKYILKNEFLPYFEAWESERKEISKDNVDALFVKKDGSPASAGTVRSWVRTISSVLGKSYYPHASRHRITTLLSLKGIPHNLIQALMGWKSADLVEIYDDSTIHDKKWEELDSLR